MRREKIWKEAARKQAKVNGLDFDDVLSPEEIRKIHDLSGENNQVVRTLEDSEEIGPICECSMT